MEVDFEEDAWKDTCLVTPCHAVRNEWNEAATRKNCIGTHHQLFLCPADDTIAGKALTQHELYLLESCKSGKERKCSKDLVHKVQLTIGMDIMVTNNIEMDLDVTNGACSKVVKIVLHPDEPPIGDSPMVQLQYLPSYVLVKLSQTCTLALPGLKDHVIPIEPITTTYHIKEGRQSSLAKDSTM